MYAFHHRARLPPRGPFTPTPCSHHNNHNSSSNNNNNRLLLAHASGNGLAAWLFLGALPSSSAATATATGPLPLRLLLQNYAHDVALLPYQRLRLAAASSSSSASAMDVVVDGGAPTHTRARTISHISAGTSLAAASSASSSGSDNEGEEEGEGGDVDFFLDDEEKGEQPDAAQQQEQQQQGRRKHTHKDAHAAGPCVVARNERRLEGAARIPWRRFKVQWERDGRKAVMGGGGRFISLLFSRIDLGNPTRTRRAGPCASRSLTPSCSPCPYPCPPAAPTTHPSPPPSSPRTWSLSMHPSVCMCVHVLRDNVTTTTTTDRALIHSLNTTMYNRAATMAVSFLVPGPNDDNHLQQRRLTLTLGPQQHMI